MLSKKTFVAFILGIIFIATGLMANQSEARNCGVSRANIIDDVPTGTMGGQIPETMVRDGKGDNQVAIVARGISDQASPKGFDMRNFFLLRVTVEAGGHSFWHFHPGVNIVMVKSGQASYYTVNVDGSCTEHTVSPTDGFIELPGMVHAIENKTSEPLVLYLSALMHEELANFTSSAPEEPSGDNCPAGFGTSNSNGDEC